ncbi:hypothetical protein LIER_24207 [Lithospermum erythrorhizon]|uniref:Uncharacterized protein n=1 Tax=Lithospermum erythrorhizon TaxID=34254 RepID=A0AAV3R1H0_LITER
MSLGDDQRPVINKDTKLFKVELLVDGGTNASAAKRVVFAVGSAEAFSLPPGRMGSLVSGIPLLLRLLQVLSQQVPFPGKLASSTLLKAQGVPSPICPPWTAPLPTSRRSCEELSCHPPRPRMQRPPEIARKVRTEQSSVTLRISLLSRKGRKALWAARHEDALGAMRATTCLTGGGGEEEGDAILHPRPNLIF